MKKTIIRAFALCLSVLMIASCTACKTKYVTSEYTYESEVMTWAEGLTKEEIKELQTNNDIKVEVNTTTLSDDTPAQKALQAELKDTAKGKTVTILSTWGENGIDNQMYKQMFKQFCGGDVKIIRVADYSAMQEKLATMHMSDEAPDIYEMTNQDFPSLMYRGILTRLDDKIDFTSELYTNLQKQDMELVKWNGALYFVPNVRSQSSRCIWWNRSIFEQAGIPANEMPDALISANKWTPEALYDLQKRLTNNDTGVKGMGSTSGASVSYMNAAAYGEDFVKLNGKTIKSNFTSPTITRAMNMYKKIYKGDVYQQTESATQIFLQGKLAMLVGSATSMGSAKAKEMMKQGILQCIPWPKEATASTYTIMGDIGGWAVPTGSKEPAAAINFIKMMAASDTYETQRQEYKAIQGGYSDNAETKEYINKIRNGTYNVIPCYSLGIKEIHSIMWNSDKMGANWLNSDVSWETRGAELDPEVQSILDKLG